MMETVLVCLPGHPRKFDVACLAVHGTLGVTAESDAHGDFDTFGSRSGVRIDVQSRISVESAFSVRRRRHDVLQMLTLNRHGALQLDGLDDGGDPDLKPTATREEELAGSYRLALLQSIQTA